MVRPEVIRKRLQKLDEYLAILQSLQKYSLDAFLNNPERYGSAERFLHLSIEALLDLGNHIIAELELGQVNWYSDIPMLLNKAGYLDHDLKEKWIKMIGFRNVLVHDYLDIDRKIVYDVLANYLQDMAALKRVFAQFL